MVHKRQFNETIRPPSCRDSGWGGVDVGALCLSSWKRDSVGLYDIRVEVFPQVPHKTPTESLPGEDKHKAPALPRVRPLSLQVAWVPSIVAVHVNRGCDQSHRGGRSW
jgi:hypothetical protein